MLKENKKFLSVLDNTIVFFFILFLLTLTNSIFLNQLGYYGALLLVIFKGFIHKENPFSKTGLEIAFVWFIISELISMALAQKTGEAVHFMLKRVLLIPIVYTAVASSMDIKKAKLYLKVYIGASLISIIIYLGFSVQYFIYDLYSRTESGPSIFQYPITVSEITSFTVVILFAFLVHEKTTMRNKILLFIGFVLAGLALLSTFKRTGWMGAAFGIFIILVIKKQWKILIPAVLLVLAVVLLDKNKSQVIEYTYTNGKLNKTEVIQTPGRAYDVINIDSSVYVSDHENGINLFQSNTLLKKAELPSPVISVKKWNDSLYAANLVDTRFILLKKHNGSFTAAGEFLSPGLTNAYRAENNVLYVNDKDSGITVFNNPADLKDTTRFSELNGFSGISVDTSYMLNYISDKGAFLYSLKDKKPAQKISEYKYDGNISFAEIINGKAVISGDKGTVLLNLTPSGFTIIDSSKEIKNIYKLLQDSKLFAVTSQREVIELNPELQHLHVVNKNKIDFTPIGAAAKGNKLYFTLVKRNRILSVFDMYVPSNFTRIALWSAGMKLHKDHPLFGVGDVDIADYYRQYKHPYDKEVQGHFHNNFIHILATLGIFGFAAVVFLFFKYLQISFGIYKKRITVPFVSSFALGVIGAFCAFLVSGLTELNFFDHEIATLLWFLFGLNAAFFKLTNDNK